jgi:esterase/lipase superfamily enzyme
MPDGGLVGWYTDWIDDSCCDPQRWETHHIDEVLPWTEQMFRIAPGRSQRFVAGDSMGGYGTMHYAARYPDRFGGAAELSGFVDTMLAETSGVIGVDGQSFQTYQIPPGSVFGDRVQNEVHWRGHNPVDLAANLFATDLVLRHGNGMPGEHGGNPDAGEAAIRLTGVSFHERLDELGIDHLWDDYGDGTHIWPYWEEGLRIAMPRWLAIAADGEPDPVPFSYTTIDPQFEVYGFDVTLDRGVREFATLTDVKPAGFTLTGSGTASITTAGWYAPGAAYAVSVGDASATSTADADGRLEIEVDLGPSHATDQFSPQARVEEAAAGDAYFTTATVTIQALAGAPAQEPGNPDPTDPESPMLPVTGGGATALALFALTGSLLRRRSG